MGYDDTGLATKLAEAVRANDAERVQELITLGADPNSSVSADSSEPLVFAAFVQRVKKFRGAFSGDREEGVCWIEPCLDSLRILLANAANPNVVNDIGQTPLILCAHWFLFDMAKLLLDNGADPNLGDQGGSTPLMWAVLFGCRDAQPMPEKQRFGELLLDRGAHIDARNDQGFTALMYAAMNERLEMAELLMRRGASTDIRDAKGRRAMDFVKDWFHSPERFRAILANSAAS